MDIDFKEKIKDISKIIKTSKDKIENEAQTRHSFIDPFLEVMGYDRSAVKVEAQADFPGNNGMRADYILFSKCQEPVILIESKHHKEKLENHLKQLVNYFNNTRYKENTKKVKFSVLTNGIEYRFYTDLDNDNLLDEEPFMVIDLEKLTLKDFEYLKKFSRNSLNIEEAKSFALEKKYTDKLLVYLKQEIKNTSNDFSRFLKNKINFNKKKSNKIFENIIKNAFNLLAENNNTVNNQENNIEDDKDFAIKDNNNNNTTTTNNKTENLKRFEKLNPDLKEIYEDLESFVFSLSPNEIEKVETKEYTAFKIKNENFVDFNFTPQVNKINITVDIPLNQITLKEGFIRDAKKIGKSGVGDIQIFCTSKDQIQEIKNLIEKSYKNIFSN